MESRQQSTASRKMFDKQQQQQQERRTVGGNLPSTIPQPTSTKERQPSTIAGLTSFVQQQPSAYSPVSFFPSGASIQGSAVPPTVELFTGQGRVEQPKEKYVPGTATREVEMTAPAPAPVPVPVTQRPVASAASVRAWEATDFCWPAEDGSGKINTITETQLREKIEERVNKQQVLSSQKLADPNLTIDDIQALSKSATAEAYKNIVDITKQISKMWCLIKQLQEKK
jgi:hypothetical protein